MSLEIKIHSSIVMHAIEKYVKEQYGLDADLDVHSENCAVSEGVVMIDYRELDPVHKKYKNGRIVKDKFGLPIVDYQKSKFVKRWLEFDDSCEINFHLNNKEGW